MNQKTLLDFLSSHRKDKVVRLFFDIETLQYNTDEGKVKPTKYKNVTYSLAVSWIDDTGELDESNVSIFKNFKPFFDLVEQAFTNPKNRAIYRTIPKIELIAHNNNKYDNHFILQDIKYYYPHVKIENIFLKNANQEANLSAKKVTQLSNDDKKAYVLEKRIKSRVNLELNFFINGINYYTVDNYMKTNVSIATLGIKLKNKNLINENQLKTAFDYEIFNKPYNMTDEYVREYASDCFEQLTEKQLTYIRNDVIILGKAVQFYSTIFKGFDYSKITFTSNILEFYNDNNLTSYQLLNRVHDGNGQVRIDYTDYKFANENFYDYLKPFYKGGLNFYNYQYIAKIVNEPIFAIDIHSSYPYAMHKFKIPTFLKEFETYEKETEIEIHWNEDTYFLYRVSRETFDSMILDRIKSRVLKEMLVKYFNGHETIHINSYTIKMLEEILHIKFPILKVFSWLKYETKYFGSREKIEEQYFIKTQGKEKNKLIMKSPYEFTKTDQGNTENIFTEEEYNNSKVLLNGLYGIPALRPYFNLFRRIGNELKNYENGYANAQRNIVFSIFVTSVALYNLLKPFQFLTADEIDNDYLYSDTDSHYFKKKILHKIPEDYFDPYALGTWNIDDENIRKFYVLNHKKYAYETWDNKKQEWKIVVKCAGIPEKDGHGNPTFNLNQSFECFIEKEFSEGVHVFNTKSIYNEQGVISIYPSETVLDKGKAYKSYATDHTYLKEKEKLFEEIRDTLKGEEEDYLYIESNLGTFSLADINPVKHTLRLKEPLEFLQIKQDYIKEVI